MPAMVVEARCLRPHHRRGVLVPEREEVEAWLDSRQDDVIAHMEAKWAKQDDPDTHLDALEEK